MTTKDRERRKLARWATVTIALLVFAAATTAARDPFVGIWRMNHAKSKYAAGLPPREQIATITVKGRNMQVKVEAVTAEGKKTVVHYEIPYDGGMGRIFETSPAYDGILGRHLGPYEREISRLKDGKAVFTARSIVSPDGNLMSVYSKGVSPLGKPVEAHVVYDRVK
jgi:hypothetical protein